MNSTPRGSRVHIALFGQRNAGKSSLINALTNQSIALVSDVKGTTTDPVYKAMELLPIGPIVMIDTAGIDDNGNLGALRVEKTYEVLNKTDLALVIIDGIVGMSDYDRAIIVKIKEKNIPFLIVINKADSVCIEKETKDIISKEYKAPVIAVSAKNKSGMDKLKQEMIHILPTSEDKFQIVGDLLNPGDFVVLVTPIDKAAPKGRLILPQQQVIRDILEADAMAIVTKEFELRETLEKLGTKPKLVITDSQVFSKVSADTPKDILLTSFSILFARYKGNLETMVKGAMYLEQLKDGDKILISEGCTHHRQSDDIGTVKIPRWMRQYTGKQLIFEYSSGFQYPNNSEEYALIVHCGGCMLNKREMQYRLHLADKKGIPIVNYGVLIAYVQGILERVIQPFPNVSYLFDSIQ